MGIRLLLFYLFGQRRNLECRFANSIIMIMIITDIIVLVVIGVAVFEFGFVSCRYCLTDYVSSSTLFRILIIYIDIVGVDIVIGKYITIVCTLYFI